MKPAAFLAGLALTALVLVPAFQPAQADELPEKYRETVRKGLEYLAKQQHKDGHWGANGDQYPVSMTALGGLALLMEGSTIREGKYAINLRRATDWLMAKSMRGNLRDGLIGNPDIPTEAGRYMYGHGFGLLFLASVYGDEEDRERREKLKDILTRAVKYSAAAQSSKGGWYYTSRAEGGDNDEGSVTITQVQALRACRNAGIPVPREIIKKCYSYLKECTSPNGAVYYSFRSKTERPAITAAAVACLFNAGEYKDELAKKWLKYCKRTIPYGLGGGQGGLRIGHDEYTHFYFAQCVYILGDDGWEKLFPGGPANDRLTWTEYRNSLFDQLQRSQNQDGSWSSGGGFSVGAVYSTALYCIIMQLEKGTLPIFQK
jgi:hypothetical protein